MIGLGRLDQLPIGVDTDHDMPASGQFGANSSRPAAGIQHTRPAREHRIEQPGLPAKVHSLGGHPAEPFDVPLGVTDAVRRDPTRQLTHPTTVAGHAPTPATANAPRYVHLPALGEEDFADLDGGEADDCAPIRRSSRTDADDPDRWG